jgi:hypothetical protein
VNRALWLLIGLQLHGWVRFFLRGLLTLRGALLGILGATCFSMWLVSVVFVNRVKAAGEPAYVPLYGPSLLLFYCVLNVMLSSGERGIYFTPAEVNFLFPAPISRRSLLVYKIAASIVIGLPSALILAALTYGYSTSFLNAFIGMTLVVVFMQLFTLALNLLAVTVGARLYARGRRLLGVAAVLFAVVVLWRVGHLPDSGQLFRWLKQVDSTTEWKTLTLPLTWFFQAFSAPRIWPDLVKYTALGLLVNGVLLGVVFALDAQYLEAAATASARLYARIQRRGTDGGGLAPPRIRFMLPLPSSLGGVGTLCWRQLTTALRMPGRVVMVFLLFVIVLAAMPATPPPGIAGVYAPAMAGGLVVVTALFLSALLPFDFRGDVDRLALLKTLPLAPWRLALGQVLAPVLLVNLLQWFVLLVLYYSSLRPGGPVRAGGEMGTTLVICGLFALPVNGLLFALENLLFLLFPTRVLANNPADFQALGRNALIMLTKLFVLVGVFALAGMVGIMIGVFYPALGLLMAWLTLAFFVAPLIPLIGWAFTVFDVRRDTPA